MNDCEFVEIDLPEDFLDWTAARKALQEANPDVRLGQLSRTAGYPQCGDTCWDDEGDRTCSHPVVMRYAARTH